MTLAGTAPPAVDPGELEQYRRELTGYCYRMLGSGFDADDAVQEVMLRAWRSRDSFQGRSSLRTWLYRIATNVCIDATRARSRRATPTQMGPSRPPVEESLHDVLPEGSWISPIADQRVLRAEADAAEHAQFRETVRLAFVAALQHLPARQRAVLILRDVLGWRAAEISTLLDVSVAAANSALQRARSTLARHTESRAPHPELDHASSQLLERYVDAFERYDIDEFVRLLRDDAIQTMPPYAMWLRGPRDIRNWMLGVGAGCRGSRLLATAANGCPAFAQYRRDPQGGHRPWGLQVVETTGDHVAAIHTFLDAPELFDAFGLPAHLP